MCGHSFFISLDSYLFRTYEFMDKTPQKAEEQIFMTMDKAQETKLQRYKSNLMFSADISKSEDISRWRLIDKAISLQLGCFFENRHKFLSEGLTFFLAMGSMRSEMKLSPRLRRNRHIHTQTHKPIAITLRLR